MPIEESPAIPGRVPAKNRPNRFQLIRQMHLYLGTFFAPALIFFSISGAFQLFSLHEGRPGSSYHPPAWIEALAQVHKHQTLATPPKRPPTANREGPRDEDHPPNAAKGRPADPVSTVLLRVFFLLMAVGLIFTTGLGIYMAFKFNRSRKLVWALLALGTVIPCGLLLG